MRTDQMPPNNIDEYIAALPKDVQETLQKIRTTIRKAAPEQETISYQMPAFTLRNNAETAERRKAFWRDRLTALKTMLEG